ncbi:MAG: hypothetical protein RL653_120 [Pseudomonadota bacterium]|jgi:hypothetical protein
MNVPQPAPLTVSDTADALERRLPSGRAVSLKADAGGEMLEIRSPSGELEVSIVLGPDGPVVKLRGARLEVDSPEIALRCKTFDVQASEQIRLQGDELRATTQRDIHLNGAFIRLNCDDGPAPTAPALPAP